MRKKLPLILKGTTAVSICLLLYLRMLFDRSQRLWPLAFAACLAILGAWLIIGSGFHGWIISRGFPQVLRLSSLTQKVLSKKNKYQG